MNDNTVHEIEVSIDQARSMVEKGRRVRELIAHPVFKEIIDDGYLLHEAARLAHLAGDPNLDPRYREIVMRDIHGPGSLKRYIQTILQQAQIAASELERAEQMLEDELADVTEVSV